MDESLTQEALLDFIEKYGEARDAGLMPHLTDEQASEASRARSAAFLALLDAVRSLPIEAGR